MVWVSWQAFPCLPPHAPRPSRFSRACNSLSLPFQTPATQARARLTGLAQLPGWISPWVYIRNFSPVFEMWKAQRSWGRVLAPNSRNKAKYAKHKILTFAPIIASATLEAISLQINGILRMWKIQQTMQDDVIQTARIRVEVFIWQNFQPTNQDLGNRASPPSPLIWTHRTFYKGFRSKVRSQKPRDSSSSIHRQ